jgi:RimJ/RimL family protein N-acetyltransferase
VNLETIAVVSARAILHFVTRDYEIWRIYSIATEQCCPTEEPSDIRPIEDLSTLGGALLEEDLNCANMQRPGAMGYAAWSGSDLKGVCWFWPGPLLGTRTIGTQPSDCAELVEIRVARSARGNGIATALIRHGGRQLYCAGYRRLFAQVWPTNRPSVRAFEKAGWEQIAWFLQFRLRFWPKRFTLRWLSRTSPRIGDALLN